MNFKLRMNIRTQLFSDSHGTLPSDFSSKSEYVKSLRSKALQVDAKVVLILQLEEVRLSSVFRINCRLIQMCSFVGIFYSLETLCSLSFKYVAI